MKRALSQSAATLPLAGAGIIGDTPWKRRPSVSLVITDQRTAEAEPWMAVALADGEAALEIVVVAPAAGRPPRALPLQNATVRLVPAAADLPVAELRRRGLQCAEGDIVLFPDEHWSPRSTPFTTRAPTPLHD